jgi:hypothetical protein
LFISAVLMYHLRLEQRSWFFLPMIEVCISFTSIRTSLGRPFVKYHYWPQQEKFHFLTDRKKTNILNSGPLYFEPPCIWSKSHDIKKKLNISTTALANGLIFLPIIGTCSHFKPIWTKLERAYIKYHKWPQQNNFTFSQIG